MEIGSKLFELSC